MSTLLALAMLGHYTPRISQREPLPPPQAIQWYALDIKAASPPPAGFYWWRSGDRENDVWRLMKY